MAVTCAAIAAGTAALGFIINKWCRRPRNDDHEEQIDCKEILYDSPLRKTIKKMTYIGLP